MVGEAEQDKRNVVTVEGICAQQTKWCAVAIGIYIFVFVHVLMDRRWTQGES